MSSSRKDDHVRLAMEQETAHRRSRDFDDVRVLHHALSAVNVETVVHERLLQRSIVRAEFHRSS